MVDWSFAPNPNCLGSYYRRIDDIERALKALGIPFPPDRDATNFVAYFFGCEKLALGIVGIKKRWPAEKAYCKNKKLDVTEIKSAVSALDLPILEQDLTDLFGVEQTPASARDLRNKLVHDFGPTQVLMISRRTDTLNKKMLKFLACAANVRGYLEKHFGHVQCPPERLKRIG